jgi:hypothetical protein
VKRSFKLCVDSSLFSFDHPFSKPFRRFAWTVPGWLLIVLLASLLSQPPPPLALPSQALDNAAKGRTTISIAHRLSTIQHADCIYYFNSGRIAEAGTHQELIALRGGYAELCQMQNLSRT